MVWFRKHILSVKNQLNISKTMNQSSSPCLWQCQGAQAINVPAVFCCCCCIASVMSSSVQPHRRQPTRLPRPWDSPGKNTEVGCHCLLQCRKAKSESEVTQSCPTLRDSTDCSLPGSSVHGIFQARVLEWGAIAFSTVFWGEIIWIIQDKQDKHSNILEYFLHACF